MRSGSLARFPVIRGMASRSSAWSSRAGVWSMPVIWVSMASRSACSSLNRWEQRARMAWAALSAGSGDRPSICMIWLRCATSIRASSLVRPARWGALGGGVGFAGGELLGELCAAFGSEHAQREELEDFADQDVFADADGAGVVGSQRGVAGVGGVVGALIVGVPHVFAASVVAAR